MNQDRIADDARSAKAAEETAGPPTGKPLTKPESPIVEGADKEKELTPDEQMALYEKELKENDWGHQPC